MLNSVCFSETYDILCHMDDKICRKIPKSFLQFIARNKDGNYKVKIDYSKDINKQELQRDTRILLSLIYRDYICSPEKKRELLQRDMVELARREEELREKYNPDNLFKKEHELRKQQLQRRQKEVSMIKYKESIVTKIIRKIKKIFG